MELGLWITQYSLLAIYGAYGIYKVFWTSHLKEKMAWSSGLSSGFIRFIGISEILGALGVVFPLLTGVLPWLTPIAAFGFSIIQMAAIFTIHLPRKEYKMLPFNIYFLAMSVFVIIGRWPLLNMGN